MPAEYRCDPVSGRWVIIAPERAARPDQFTTEQPPLAEAGTCPFCRGHEGETPPATAAFPSEEAWEVRVVPNLYPAVTFPAAGAVAPPALPAVGAHEVIIESPTHVVSLSELTAQQLFWTFTAYRDRLESLSRNEQLAYGLIFKNARAAGGASLEHTHSQLIATTSVPSEVERELAGCRTHDQREGRCLFCDLLEVELERGQRLVAATSELVAFCPYAGRFPYETWIVPRTHHSEFSKASDSLLRETGQLVRRVVQALERKLGAPAYNYWIHTAPFRFQQPSSYHWHIEVVPRLTRMAGFELGAGYFINPLAPEVAAASLQREMFDGNGPAKSHDHVI